jgi:hypothetical protein
LTRPFPFPSPIKEFLVYCKCQNRSDRYLEKDENGKTFPVCLDCDKPICLYCHGTGRLTVPHTDEYGEPSYGGFTSGPCPYCQK